MELFYIDRVLADRWPVCGGDGPSAVAVAAMLDRRVLPDEMPVLLDEAMRPVEPVCSWFRHLAYTRHQPETMRAYAQIVRRLCVFLQGRGADVLSAVEADLVAFRVARTQVQQRSVGEATWEKDVAAINMLYGWLVERGYLARRPVRMTGRGSALASGMRGEMRVRHMTLEQYRFFRDVGLGGMLPDGRLDESFRGWAPHRNRAGLELALLTGMRLQEWSTLLLPELAMGGRRPGVGLEFTIQACAKYGLRREVYVPAAALDAVDSFLMLERERMAAKAAGVLARRHAELFVVEQVDGARGRLGGVDRGRERTYLIEAMDERLRRRTVLRGAGGFEPLAVFIGHGGRMLSPSRWDAVRRAAWERMSAHAADPYAPALPREPWLFHDARHTFALQLLRHLIVRAREREAAQGGGRELTTLPEHHAFNPVLTVQRRLGHKRTSSTYVYLNYLDDPANYVDEAFAQWSRADGGTYAEIALKVFGRDGGDDAQTW